MSASFSDFGRLQLAGYAGAATGILRSRIHPLVPVAAIDVLAVALALGAINIVGTMVGGHRENPFLGDLGRTKDDLALFAVVPPPAAPAASEATARIAPKAIAFAPVPDLELLFSAPVLIGGPFEAGQGDTVRFVSLEDESGSSGPEITEQAPPPDVVASEDPTAEDPILEDPTTPVPIPGTIDDPPSPPLAKILSIAGRTQARALELASQATAPVVEAADKLVPLQKYSASEAVTTTTAAVKSAGGTAQATVAAVVAPVASTVATPVANVAAPVVSTVAAAPVTASAATTTVATVAAPVQQVAAPVQQAVQAVSQPVSNVVSAVGGLLK